MVKRKNGEEEGKERRGREADEVQVGLEEEEEEEQSRLMNSKNQQREEG